MATMRTPTRKIIFGWGNEVAPIPVQATRAEALNGFKLIEVGLEKPGHLTGGDVSVPKRSIFTRNKVEHSETRSLSDCSIFNKSTHSYKYLIINYSKISVFKYMPVMR
jgi:hypothetical protein